jgi:hypothetical protein
VSTADLFIPPPSYSASQVTFTGRTNLTGPVTVSLAPNKIGMLLFDGTAGRNVSIEIPSSSPGSCSLQLYDPTNTAFGSAGDCSQGGGGFFDAQSIPRSGTLTALMIPDPSLGSTATLNVYVFDDVNLTATLGGSAVTVTTTVPGQNAIVSFAGIAGEYVTIDLSGSTYPACLLTLNSSYGANDLTNFSCSQAQSQQLNPLPATGTYQMVIDPAGPATGTVTVQVVGAANAGALASGVPVTLTATEPSQYGMATFTGTVGEVISMLASGAYLNAGNASVIILNPDGTQLTYFNVYSGSLSFLDATALPQAGTYTVLIEPQGTTGTTTLTWYMVPPDASATATVGGSRVTVTTTVPGQNADVTFTGTAGQKITIAVTGAFTYNGSANLQLTDPSGNVLANSKVRNLGSASIGPVSLGTTGTYKLSINVNSYSTGTTTVGITTP